MSKKGLGGLASKAIRLQSQLVTDVPPPTKYSTIDQFKIKQENRYPFNSTTRRAIETATDIPGLVPLISNSLPIVVVLVVFTHYFDVIITVIEIMVII